MSARPVQRRLRHARVAACAALAALAALAAVVAACGGGERPAPADTAAEVAGATRGCPATASDTGVRVHAVNRGTHGMSATTRWIASPDGCALLIVEDPHSVEAEPVTNGALLVSERGVRPVVMAIDSVWDVAPDPTWTTLAYGRGWILSGGERDTVAPAKWEALARETGVDAGRLEARAFPGSGMAYARGVALAFIRPIEGGQVEAGGRVSPPQALGGGGWRVRWRGDTLFVGDAPTQAQDGAEPSRWTMHPPPERTAVAIPASFAPGPQRWAEGPMIAFGVPGDSTLGHVRALELAHGRVARSGGGEITIVAPGQPPRVVGPGALLAATLGGRFLLAIAPARAPKQYDPELELVVYEMGRQDR